jgi:hypothetical protein
MEEPKAKFAGKLSTSILPNVHYIGPLSRFQKMETAKKYDCIAVISGPEPQRSYFEAMLKTQLAASPLKTLLVCGKAHDKARQYKLATVALFRF